MSQHADRSHRKPYLSPSLRVYGDARALTQTQKAITAPDGIVGGNPAQKS